MAEFKKAEQINLDLKEALTHRDEVIKNKIWYRGDPFELDQIFKAIGNNPVAKARFWAAVPSEDSQIRKMHSGLPADMVNTLVDIVIPDMGGITINRDEETEDNEETEEEKRWTEIAEDYKFTELLTDAVAKTLITGDGAFKISVDTEISEYPILEFYDAEDVDFEYKRGRLFAVIFKTFKTHEKQRYRLEERYEKGKIDYKCYDAKNKEVPVGTVPDWKSLTAFTFNGEFIMAVPVKFISSIKFENRGSSIFANKTDCFDALDEATSQFVDALRAARIKTYIPKDLLPVNENTGQPLKPNSFDNQFIKTEASMKEGSQDKIEQIQAVVDYLSYTEAYSQALSLALQGILSPATLGIDLKKLDNAEAQREKEKTTLYTRNKIIQALYKIIPEIVQNSLMVHDNMSKRTAGEYQASVQFGEYASPDFDSMVDTVGRAKSLGLMSIEKAIDELYGDSMSEEEKTLEIQRIRDGIPNTEESPLRIDYMRNREDEEETEVGPDEQEEEEETEI